MDSTDAILDALVTTRRRTICRYLLSRRDRTASFDELVTHVATEERAEERTEITHLPDGAGHRRQVASSLHHQHLPKLDAADLVEYERDGTVVGPGPKLAVADSILQAANDPSEPPPA